MVKLVLEEVECSKCNNVIDWNGDCKCKRPYPPMTSAEYTARFTHPFMRRTMPDSIDPAGGVKH
jgi:hypothetical protein